MVVEKSTRVRIPGDQIILWNPLLVNLNQFEGVIKPDVQGEWDHPSPTCCFLHVSLNDEIGDFQNYKLK